VQAVGRHRRWTPDDAALHDARDRPAQTTLHCQVRQHAPSFIAETDPSTGAELPRFIKGNFDAFLKCGILTHG
jgi:hypothetical protein